jgi:Holliday junction resolvasome RuvABC endonuclease subunit
MKARKDVIVTIAPTSRGFGYAIFAAPTAVMDWGVKETRWDKNQLTKSKVQSMLQEVRPAAVVIENWFHESCRRSARVRELLCDLAVVAHRGGATAMTYSRQHIRLAFGECGKSKDTIARAIASTLPALKPWLPPKRRIWESEHHSMAIFEAAALALTHYANIGSFRMQQFELGP